VTRLFAAASSAAADAVLDPPHAVGTWRVCTTHSGQSRDGARGTPLLLLRGGHRAHASRSRAPKQLRDGRRRLAAVFFTFGDQCAPTGTRRCQERAQQALVEKNKVSSVCNKRYTVTETGSSVTKTASRTGGRTGVPFGGRPNGSDSRSPSCSRTEGRTGETPVLDNRCQALTVTLAVVRRSRWYFERSQLMQTNRMAWSCRINIAMILRGLHLDLITWGLEFYLAQYYYSSVDIAISPTRRRRDHRCDSSSSCDPIALVTDLVSAGATAHHHTKSRTFPAEGFRATSIPNNRSICSQYICEQCQMIEGRRTRLVNRQCSCSSGF